MYTGYLYDDQEPLSPFPAGFQSPWAGVRESSGTGLGPRRSYFALALPSSLPFLQATLHCSPVSEKGLSPRFCPEVDELA